MLIIGCTNKASPAFMRKLEFLEVFFSQTYTRYNNYVDISNRMFGIVNQEFLPMVIMRLLLHEQDLSLSGAERWPWLFEIHWCIHLGHIYCSAEQPRNYFLLSQAFFLSES